MFGLAFAAFAALLFYALLEYGSTLDRNPTNTKEDT